MKRVNQYQQPIGAAVPDWQPRKFPGEIVYTGHYTIVTNLTAAHIPELYEVFKNSQPANWTYLPEEPPKNFAAFEQMLMKKIASPTEIFYVVLAKKNQQPLGIFSLMRIDQNNGVIEVGHVHFSDALRKTRISTEAHYLLARYVFEELRYRRYEWKCDALNAPSNQTARRLGFQFEGTFRNNIVYKQRTRSTNWFSMLQEEWPQRKQAFLRWLSADNFDEQGRQRQKIEAFRTEQHEDKAQ